MEYTITIIICVLSIAGFSAFMIYSGEPEPQIGITINVKPGIKVSDSYCYDISTNRYEICL